MDDEILYTERLDVIKLVSFLRVAAIFCHQIDDFGFRFTAKFCGKPHCRQADDSRRQSGVIELMTRRKNFPVTVIQGGR